ARSSGVSLSSVLHLANSQEIEDKIGNDNGRIAKLVKDKVETNKAIEELYLAAYSRLPTAAEMKRGLAHVEKQKDVRSGLEDLLWAILNTRGFLFNHGPRASRALCVRGRRVCRIRTPRRAATCRRRAHSRHRRSDPPSAGSGTRVASGASPPTPGAAMSTTLQP